MPGMTLLGEALTFLVDEDLVNYNADSPDDPPGDSFEDRCRNKLMGGAYVDSRVGYQTPQDIIAHQMGVDDGALDLSFLDDSDDEFSVRDQRIAAIQVAELARQAKENRVSYPALYTDHWTYGIEVDESAPVRECSRTCVPVKDLCHKRVESKKQQKTHREDYLDFEGRLVFDKNRHCVVTPEMRARRSRKWNARTTIRGASVDLIVHTDNFGLTAVSWFDATPRTLR